MAQTTSNSDLQTRYAALVTECSELINVHLTAGDTYASHASQGVQKAVSECSDILRRVAPLAARLTNTDPYNG
jgi:predicted ATP-binding protein involved in virulence